MIILKNKNLEIQINSDLGAALHYFRFNGKDVLRPALDNVNSPIQQSLFLMLPYCSYIKDGHFNYFGISRHVPQTAPEFPFPIHGDAWLKKWTVEKQTDTSATLSYIHKKENGFPFNYTAKVCYELEQNQLKITLTIYNPSDLPMPCGMGVHPYFLYPQNAKLSFPSSHIWYHKNDPIFDRPYPTPSQWNFEKGAVISEDFDTAFGGWNGIATISYPYQNLKIDISAQDIFHHLILYAPKNVNYFCLEPVSNTPDAFNLAAYGVIGTGIQSVGAKQSLSKTITFACSCL